jgi:hypothetical protein
VTVRRFRYEYGAGPVHLLATLATLAVTAYVAMRVVDGSVGSPIGFLVWFVAAIVAHDFVLLPLYSLLDRLPLRAAGVRRALPEDERRLVLGRREGRWVVEPAGRTVGPRAVSAINHVRFPALVSGLMLLLFFPLVLGLAEEEYALVSGQSTDGFLERWALLTATLFALSAAAYAVRRLRARRTAGAGR